MAFLVIKYSIILNLDNILFISHTLPKNECQSSRQVRKKMNIYVFISKNVDYVPTLAGFLLMKKLLCAETVFLVYIIHKYFNISFHLVIILHFPEFIIQYHIEK